jgi:hypothetical protein
MSSDRNAIQQLADQLRQLLCWQGRGAIFLGEPATSDEKITGRPKAGKLPSGVTEVRTTNVRLADPA